MKYLIKDNIVMSTENWAERHTIIKKEMNEKAEVIETKVLQSIEDYAKEHGYTIVDKKPESLTTKETQVSLENEYADIMFWLNQNDWKVNKITVGEWETTDPRWLEYKEQRAVKRARLDKIKEALGI